jgi:hypothetical protein
MKKKPARSSTKKKRKGNQSIVDDTIVIDDSADEDSPPVPKTKKKKKKKKNKSVADDTADPQSKSSIRRSQGDDGVEHVDNINHHWPFNSNPNLINNKKKKKSMGIVDVDNYNQGLDVEYPVNVHNSDEDDSDEDDNAYNPFFTQKDNSDEIIKYSELNYKMYPLGSTGEMYQDFDDTITDSEAQGLLHDLNDNQFLFYRRRIGAFCYVEVIRVEKICGTCYIVPKNPYRGWKKKDPEDDEWKAIEYSCLIHLKFSDGPKAEGIQLPGHFLLVQDTLRRPFSESMRDSRIDHNRTMTQYLSQQGHVIGGLLPLDMQGLRTKEHVDQKGKKRTTYYCEMIVKIGSDGTLVGCSNQRKSGCGNLCTRHHKQANQNMYGESIIPTDDHILKRRKSTAKAVYDELVSKYYDNNASDNDDEYDDTGDDSESLIWINAESKVQQETVI